MYDIYLLLIDVIPVVMPGFISVLVALSLTFVHSSCCCTLHSCGSIHLKCQDDICCVAYVDVLFAINTQ